MNNDLNYSFYCLLMVICIFMFKKGIKINFNFIAIIKIEIAIIINYLYQIFLSNLPYFLH
jgi:hypothetical protein